MFLCLFILFTKCLKKGYTNVLGKISGSSSDKKPQHIMNALQSAYLGTVHDLRKEEGEGGGRGVKKSLRFLTYGIIFSQFYLFLTIFLHFRKKLVNFRLRVWRRNMHSCWARTTPSNSILGMITLFLGPILLFGALMGYFWGWGRVRQLFWGLLMYLNNFPLLYFFQF